MSNTYNDLMRQTYQLATLSPDPSSQNGAALIDNNMQILTAGCNHFYQGIEPEVNNRDEKLRRIEHAERDAIYQAANAGVTVFGTTLITPWAACCDCARAIIGSGVSRLIYHHDRYLLTDKRWIDQVNESLGWIARAGIDLFCIEGAIPGAPNILISGRLWSPESCEYVD